MVDKTLTPELVDTFLKNIGDTLSKTYHTHKKKKVIWIDMDDIPSGHILFKLMQDIDYKKQLTDYVDKTYGYLIIFDYNSPKEIGITTEKYLNKQVKYKNAIKTDLPTFEAFVKSHEGSEESLHNTIMTMLKNNKSGKAN